MLKSTLAFLLVAVSLNQINLATGKLRKILVEILNAFYLNS